MTVVLALIGALALASIPIVLGWERGAAEAEMAETFGIAYPKRRFDPEKWAMQTGTGLRFNQLVVGLLAWVGGGFLLGLFLGRGLAPAILFLLGGGLLYVGVLDSRRQGYRAAQAEDILAAVTHLRTLLAQGRPLIASLEEVVRSTGPTGKPVLVDLVQELRSTDEAHQADAVRRWSQRWETLVDDMLAAALIVAIEGRVQITDLLRYMQEAIGEQLGIVRRARARARGLEWQARALALWPVVVLVMLTLLAGGEGGMLTLWRVRPVYLLPVLLGSLASFLLTQRDIRTRLSVESTMGLIPGKAGEIPTDRFGNPL